MSQEEALSDDEFAELVVLTVAEKRATESDDWKPELATHIERWLAALDRGRSGRDERTAITLFLRLTEHDASRGQSGLGEMAGTAPTRVRPVSDEHRQLLERIIAGTDGTEGSDGASPAEAGRRSRLRRLFAFGRSV